MKLHHLLLLLLSLSLPARANDTPQPIVRPQAKAQTTPVPHSGDAADDPAIWIHPSDPHQSLILGTDKQGGLHVYDLDGTHLQLVSPDCRPNNVDILYSFKLDGAPVDLAIASVRSHAAHGAKVWLIDPQQRRLRDITQSAALPTFHNSTPYGICTYHSAKSGRCFYFVTSHSGAIEQYELLDAGEGRVSAKRVRTLKLKSVTEGCVADDQLGFVYFAEENVGIWKFPAEPDARDPGALIARVGQHGLKADVEGLTLYCASNGRGYLIASSQGSNTFKVYTREGNNDFVLTIDAAPGLIDDVNDTDGIAVTNCPTSDLFPQGLFIAQDGHNSHGHQNFKLYDWRDIATPHLTIDTTPTPR